MNAANAVHPYSNQAIALIGYGVTGKACADYLLTKNAIVTVFDKTDVSDSLSAIKGNIQFCLLGESTDLLAYDQVVVSPGVNLNQDYIRQFKATGKPVIGDIELFARENTIPVIAVTGSNGKSTVVDMLRKCLISAGYKVGLGGNFGTSALAMLGEDYDYIVLELSSFQLESTNSLQACISCVLNITPDHIDRHGSMHEYAMAKVSIYRNAEHLIFNREDPLTYPVGEISASSSSIGIAQAAITQHQGREAHFYQDAKGIWLNNALLLSTDTLHSISQHQLLNMQVVLACTHYLGIALTSIVNSLYGYTGLAHRFELIASNDFSEWINDSKATNPGATVAAIESLVSKSKRILLIAGGDGKGADMSALLTCLHEHVAGLILMGKDREVFTQANVPYVFVNTMQEAVVCANEMALNTFQTTQERSTVMLSPACASIDMFRNYQQRGELFSQAAREVCAS